MISDHDVGQKCSHAQKLWCDIKKKHTQSEATSLSHSFDIVPLEGELPEKETLTSGLGVHQQEVSWRVCTGSGTPGRHLSAGCERNGQRCGVPAGPRHPDTDEDSQSYSSCEQQLRLAFSGTLTLPH